MTKKILLLGSNGQLGQALNRSFQNKTNVDLIQTTRLDINIQSQDAVHSFIKNINPDYVINCIAYTAVDKAEAEPDLANLANHHFVRFLADSVNTLKKTLVHISTDFVFDGTSNVPYLEDAQTNPISVYGQTKLSGELAFKKVGVSGINIRTSWLYSQYNANFYKTILRLGREKDFLKIISDQIGTPTLANDLADFIATNFAQTADFTAETFHFSNEGVASWFDFAESILEYHSIDKKIYAIRTHEYPTPAQRPKYSVLDKNKIKEAFKFSIPSWRSSLKKCIKEVL